MREREEVAAAMARRVKLLRSAGHALRSYQYGNGSDELARSIAEDIERELAAENYQARLDEAANAETIRASAERHG